VNDQVIFAHKLLYYMNLKGYQNHHQGTSTIWDYQNDVDIVEMKLTEKAVDYKYQELTVLKGKC
jgi:hypothetical protein